MNMDIETIKDIADIAKNLATVGGVIIGGLWAYRRFIRQEEDFPHIEFSADINFVAEKGDWWIVELISTIKNKGRVQHKVSDFVFDLAALDVEDSVEVSSQWGGQVNFPRQIAQGSFLPEENKFFFIDPGVDAKYSFVARVPRCTEVLLLHTSFKYGDDRGYTHTAECSVAVPNDLQEANKCVEQTA